MRQRRLDAAVLAQRQLLDAAADRGRRCQSISPCSMRRKVASSISSARGILKRDQAVLDAVEGRGSGVDRHGRPSRDGEALADGLVDGERAMRDMIADPANDDGVIGRVAHRSRGSALAMGRIDPVLPAPFQDRMDGDEPALIENADQVGQLVHLDDAARPVGNAVVVAADRDQPVVADAALELQQRVEGDGRQRLQLRLLGSKGLRDDPLGRAVHAGHWRPWRASRRAGH